VIDGNVAEKQAFSEENYHLLMETISSHQNMKTCDYRKLHNFKAYMSKMYFRVKRITAQARETLKNYMKMILSASCYAHT
jgi:DNA-directed RNA polymerase subunit L